MTSYTDKEIVDMYFSRDEKALKETQRKYRSYLLKIATNILQSSSQADECLDDVYLKAWNTIPPQKPENLATYLGKIARNIAIDLFRKRAAAKRKNTEYAQSVDELCETLPANNLTENEVEAKELGQLINSFVSALPQNSREVFVGRYYYMDSIKEIARYTKNSEANVKNILYRTRNKLKEFLAEKGYYYDT